MQRDPSRARRIVVISDFCEGDAADLPVPTVDAAKRAWLSGERGPAPTLLSAANISRLPPVVGSYLERLPLAAVRQGICDTVEIWTFWSEPSPPPHSLESPVLTRRSFRPDDPLIRPFSSADMLGHITAYGPPEILCVWGLGVDETILEACSQSLRMYNSIDAPALRVPEPVSRHFDIVITGAEWQSREVNKRHPDMVTAVMPIGPEFASPETFYPMGIEKVYDVVYVAAAQPYKKHEVLFNALARLPKTVTALCVCGYGELGESLRAQVQERGLSVDFIGPPGVEFTEVNRLMNLARIGVVCGVDDGAPAILTEYMLAGLPVLANAGLSCGRQYITPATGRSAPEECFHLALQEMLNDLDCFDPRETVLRNWTWSHSAIRFAALVQHARERKDARGPSHDAKRLQHRNGE